MLTRLFIGSVLVLMLYALCPSVAPGAWGSGCGPVGPAVVRRVHTLTGCQTITHVQERYKWGEVDEPGHLGLYRNGELIGMYDLNKGTYHRRIRPGLYEIRPTTPPFAPPQVTGACTGPVTQNFGLNLDQLSASGNKYGIGGQQVTREEVMAALAGKPALVEGDKIPDDSAKLRLTVIGTDQDCRRVGDDLDREPMLREFKDRYVLQCYRPDKWAVQRYGFRTAGQPTIYVQRPDGTVMHRQDDYDGPVTLATALRKVDPSYQPQTDKDLRKSPLLPNIDLSPPVIIGALLGMALLFIATMKG